MRHLVIAGLAAVVGSSLVAACDDTITATGGDGGAGLSAGGASNQGGDSDGDSGRGGQATGGNAGASEMAGAGGASADGGAAPEGGRAGEGGSGGGPGPGGAGSGGDSGGASDGGSGMGGASGPNSGGNGGEGGSDGPCGDGMLVAPEVCDDGDDDPDDGCTDCEVDFAHSCNMASPSQCTGPPHLGTFSTGASITETPVTPVAQGVERFYSINFSSAVEVHLSLDAFEGGGDPDLYVYDRTGTVLGVSQDTGPEVNFILVLQPGRYYLGVVAYRALPGGFELYVSTEAP